MNSKVTGERSYRYVPQRVGRLVRRIRESWVGHFHGGTYDYFDTPYNINGTPTNNHRGDYQTDTLGGFARTLVKAHLTKKSPFFMYVSFTAPHYGGPTESDDPRRNTFHFTRADGNNSDFATPARPDWVKGRFDRIITRPPGFPRSGGPAEADVSDKPQKLRKLTVPRGRMALTEVTRQRAESIYVMDRQIGRLVRTIKQRGEWADTVVIFTSDNGYFLGEHRQRTGKTKAHEPSLRVPFVITGPGLRGGQVRNDPITTVDLTATILDIAGATPPHPPDGQSRLPTMLDGDQGWTVPVVTEATHTTKGKRTDPAFPRGDARTSVGLRTARYSFTRYDNSEGELYDLFTDPAQMDNLYEDPGHRHVRDGLDRLWADYKDCAGSSCRTLLPEQFSADPSTLSTLTSGYWERINDLYGWVPRPS